MFISSHLPCTSADMFISCSLHCSFYIAIILFFDAVTKLLLSYDEMDEDPSNRSLFALDSTINALYGCTDFNYTSMFLGQLPHFNRH